MRLKSQQDSTVGKPQGSHLCGCGYSSEQELLQGARRGLLQGHHLSGTACALGRGTDDGSLASGLTPWLLLAQGGPASPHGAKLGTGRLPVFYSCGRVSPTSPGVTAGAVPANTQQAWTWGTTVSAEAGRAWGMDSSMPPPSEDGNVGAQQDGGGSCSAPDSEQRFAFGSPVS